MRDWDKTIREEWFTQHEAVRVVVADKLAGHAMWVLNWRKPETGMYGVRYIIDANKLIVTGDLGYAIYLWSEPITFEFVADCDLGYFSGKCKASEKGYQYTQWYEGEARKELELWVEEAEENGETKEERRKKLDTLDFDGAWNAISDEHTWADWLRTYGRETFRSDDWFDWFNIGIGVDVRCRAHLIGLKMAMEQLGE